MQNFLENSGTWIHLVLWVGSSACMILILWWATTQNKKYADHRKAAKIRTTAVIMTVIVVLGLAFTLLALKEHEEKIISEEIVISFKERS